MKEHSSLGQRNDAGRRELLLKLVGGLVGLATLGSGVGYAVQNPEIFKGLREKLPGLNWALGKRSSSEGNLLEGNKENPDYLDALLEVFRRTLADLDLTLMTNGQYWNKSPEEQEVMLRLWNVTTENAVAKILGGKAEWCSADLWEQSAK